MELPGGPSGAFSAASVLDLQRVRHIVVVRRKTSYYLFSSLPFYQTTAHILILCLHIYLCLLCWSPNDFALSLFCIADALLRRSKFIFCLWVSSASFCCSIHSDPPIIPNTRSMLSPVLKYHHQLSDCRSSRRFVCFAFYNRAASKHLVGSIRYHSHHRSTNTYFQDTIHWELPLQIVFNN